MSAPVRIRVRVQPGASRSAVLGWHGDALRVAVTAPPVGGAANEAVCRLVAETLAVSRRAVRVVRGAASRNKVLSVTGADEAACRQRLAHALARQVDKAGGGG